MKNLKKVYCLTPIYNDWESFGCLVTNISELQQKLSHLYNFSIIAINDGSTDEVEFKVPNSLVEISLLNLKVNVGHQRAIAIGLQYIYNEIQEVNFVVVLDGDGEDKPEDITLLLNKVLENNSRKIVFAKRKRRQESLSFKLGYFIYKQVFYFFTGQKISFGNFCAIPINLLENVVLQDSIWNHFSGGIIQSKIPYDMVFIDRGKRYKGKSKMNFNNLVLHGLSSISIYFDFLTLKILKSSIFGIIVCSISIGYILYQKLFTDNAIPGWASSLILIITGIILQLFLVTLVVLLLQLSSRKNIISPNARKYVNFIKNDEIIEN